MKKEKILYWTPRIIGIIFTLFMMLFGFDMIGQYTGWELIIATIMDMTPAILTLGVLFIAWRWPRIGGLIYIALGFTYIFMMRFDADIIPYLIIVLPLWITGLLFWREAIKKNKK